MELRVNDYVRTKKGMIAKIIDKKDVSGSLHNEEIVFILDNGNTLAINSMKVVKSSPNIIDLIEPWDLLYIDIEYGFAGGLVVPRIYETQAELDEAIEKIKNDEERELVGIVTHEQLENMMYEVKK